MIGGLGLQESSIFREDFELNHVAKDLISHAYIMHNDTLINILCTEDWLSFLVAEYINVPGGRRALILRMGNMDTLLQHRPHPFSFG